MYLLTHSVTNKDFVLEHHNSRSSDDSPPPHYITNVFFYKNKLGPSVLQSQFLCSPALWSIWGEFSPALHWGGKAFKLSTFHWSESFPGWSSTGEYPCWVEVRCEQLLAITHKEYRKLIPFIAHDMHSVSCLAWNMNHTTKRRQLII